MNKTKIEWTDYTWNPVTGCHKVSRGCKHCYAETLTTRFGKAWGKQSFRHVETHPDRLNEPVAMGTKLHGKKVFVCDMSDLFHKDVPFEFIALVYAKMIDCPDTIFQVLTKQPMRMIEFFDFLKLYPNLPPVTDYMKNIWHGVSIEDQITANERIPLLLQVPSSVHFLSCEPLLEKINLQQSVKNIPSFRFIDWVIVGGESGHGAQPLHPDWVRSLRDQCKDISVPFFFKQWGEYVPYEPTAQPPFYRNCATTMEYDGHIMNHIDPETSEAGKFDGYRWYDPMDTISLCMETDSDACTFLRTGKAEAGNFLDGKQHLEFPT